MMRRAWLAALACALAAHAQVGPHPEAGIAFDQRMGAQVPMSLTFDDERYGRTDFASALGGKPGVLLMGYARCRDLCAVTLPSAAQALDRTGLVAGRDYSAIFASIDPREDAATVRQAAQRIPGDDRAAWHFLAADVATVRALAAAVGFRYRYEPTRDAFAHPEGLVILAPGGAVSRYFMGVRFEPGEIAQALRDADQGHRAEAAPPLLLLCYHFDPATGRYTLRILDILRAVGAAFALIAGACAWRMARNGKRGAP